MGMIMSVRAPMPVAEMQRPADPVTPLQRAALHGVTAPVAATEQAQATQQVPGKSGTARAEMIAAGPPSETSAEAAAIAAREAYIRASLAAGISPLPLG